MGILKPGAGLAVILAAGAVAFAPGSPVQQQAASVETPGSESYRVVEAGRETGCAFNLGEAGLDGVTRLVLAKGCAAQDRLSSLSVWADMGDGTVELRNDAGDVAMRLAEADGAAFEAYGSGAPLIMLVDARR